VLFALNGGDGAELILLLAGNAGASGGGALKMSVSLGVLGTGVTGDGVSVIGVIGVGCATVMTGDGCGTGVTVTSFDALKGGSGAKGMVGDTLLMGLGVATIGCGAVTIGWGVVTIGCGVTALAGSSAGADGMGVGSTLAGVDSGSPPIGASNETNGADAAVGACGVHACQ
jgi:hypothetical protein